MIINFDQNILMKNLSQNTTANFKKNIIINQNYKLFIIVKKLSF